MRPNPILLALVLCDMTIRDIVTHKISLIGCFSNYCTTDNPPIRCKSFTIFVCLVEGIGKVKIKTIIRNLENDEIILQNEIAEIEFNDPLIPFEFTIDVGNPIFPQFGVYAIEIYANCSILGSRLLNVSKITVKDKC